MKKIRDYIEENVFWPIETCFYNYLVLSANHFVCRELSRVLCLGTIDELSDEIEAPTLQDKFYPTTENLNRLFEIEDAVTELNFHARQARLSQGEKKRVREITSYFGFPQPSL